MIMLLFLLLPPLLYFIFKLLKSPKPPLPPGPTPWPIIGTIHLLKPLTHVSLANLAQSYGPLMMLKLGTQILAVGSSPRAAVEILRTNDRVLSARAVPHAVPLTTSEITKLSFWGDTISEHWRNIRTICRTELFSTKALETQARLRAEKAAEMVEWLRSKEGAAVNIGQVVFATVFNMFSNFFFSRDLIGLEDELGNNQVRGFLRGIIGALSAPNLSDFYPLLLGKLDVHGLRKKHREMSMKMWALWEPIVDERRKMGKGDLSKSNQDFLDVLISRGFADDKINKLLEELFQAGIDTTTSTITRTIVELLTTPQSITKLREDLDQTRFTLEHLPLAESPHDYLDACVKETLRLHPPAPLLLSHCARQQCQVMNYTIPTNARVLVNVWAIGRDPTLWEEPLEYKPERFLNSTCDFKGNEFEFLPFGAGRRICPGLPMAAKIVPLLVATLVHFFDWSCMDGSLNDQRLRATSQMIKPLFLVPKARKLKDG